MNKKIIFSLIILLGLLFRFYNLNWDSSSHLHPDERFLTMVTTDISLPSNIVEYLDPVSSELNPENADHSFFVYGLLPIVLTKISAILIGYDTYDGVTLIGRFFAGFADLLTIIIVFKFVKLLEKKYSINPSAKYFVSFLYSTFVLPIQLSHFYTVDTFLNFFLIGSLYYIVRFSLHGKIHNIIISGIFFGLALSCKVSGIYFAPLLIFFMFPKFKDIHKKDVLSVLFTLFLFSGFSYLSLRLGNPYIFSSGNIINPSLNSSFLQSISELRNLSNDKVWFPPSLQWITKLPILFSIKNLVFFGLGIFHSILICIGMYFYIKKFYNSKLIMLLVWIFVFFVYQSTQFSQNLRYFLPLYPLLAIITGIGMFTLLKRFSEKIFIPIIISLLIWPSAFFSIYVSPHSRVVASKWIYANIPSDSVIVNEHWDDALPLPLNGYSKQYTILEMPSFDPDTTEKWEKMNALHSQADYIILTSNRGWGSIPTVPDRYPRMTKFYFDLFNENLQFKKVAEFTSYPSLKYLGIPITFPDDWASEDFTVYDHPKVYIFKKVSIE
ncbi:MAG TPA: glycosyltransferase family 39 protein [Candidatus Levybacteria bacterium]|nr:glycosyltransferase family 39 protein [Candidatus Levybacteria bacterium]